MRNLKISAGHIRLWFAATGLCLLAVLCASANAAAPLDGGWNDGGSQVPVGSPLAAATMSCQTAFGSTATAKFVADRGTAQDFQCLSAGGSLVGSRTIYKTKYCAYGNVKPNTSLPTDQQCPDPPVNNCPTAGTSVGITNITTAWANGSSASASIQQKIVPDGGLGSAGSVNYCSSSCGISNSGAPPTQCWQSSVPSSTGLYRISCDVPMVSTGQPCTVGSGTGQSADPTVPPPAPPCAGAFGTVNGKPTCLDSSGSTPNNTTPAPNPGNPAPGTVGGGDKSTGVDPGTGAGTGTNGTGTGGAGTGGGGSGTNVTVEVKDIATCGLPGKPKCQMDEGDTPSGVGTALDASKTALQTAIDGVKNSASEAASDSGKDTSIGWMPMIPEGTCTEQDLPIPVPGGGVLKTDICKYTSYVTIGFELLWAAFFGFAIMGLVASATSKPHA